MSRSPDRNLIAEAEELRKLSIDDAPFDAKAASSLRVAAERLIRTPACGDLQAELESLCREISGKAVFSRIENRKQKPTRSSH